MELCYLVPISIQRRAWPGIQPLIMLSPLQEPEAARRQVLRIRMPSVLNSAHRKGPANRRPEGV